MLSNFTITLILNIIKASDLKFIKVIKKNFFLIKFLIYYSQ